MKILEITTVGECAKCGKQIIASDIISLRKIERKKIEIPVPEKCTCYCRDIIIIDIRTKVKEEVLEKIK